MQLLSVIEAVIGKGEFISADLGQRIRIEPFNQSRKPAVVFKNVKKVVIPTILADKPLPTFRNVPRRFSNNGLVDRISDNQAVVIVEPYRRSKADGVIRDDRTVVARRAQLRTKHSTMHEYAAVQLGDPRV